MPPWSCPIILEAPDPTFAVSGPLAERYSERQRSTGLWYITVSQDICPPMEYWGIYITQHARIHTSRASSSTSSSRWRSRIARWLSVLHRYTAFPLSPFLGTRVRIPRKSHFNELLYHAYHSRKWAINGRVSCDTVIYHSPVEHWRSGYLSTDGPLTENVGSGAWVNSRSDCVVTTPEQQQRTCLSYHWQIKRYLLTVRSVLPARSCGMSYQTI